MDLLVESSAGNLQRLLPSLDSFGEGYACELSLSDLGDEEGAARLVEASEGCQIDIFTRMGGRRWKDLPPHDVILKRTVSAFLTWMPKG